MARSQAGTPLSLREASPRPANSPGAATLVHAGGNTSAYGIHAGDPLAEPAEAEPAKAPSSHGWRNAPPTRMSNKSHMSTASYGRPPTHELADTRDSASAMGDDDSLIPPRRTLRRMFVDHSHYQQDEFLHGLEQAPAYWAPTASTRNTLFHTGFYRGAVTGQDAIRKEWESGREERSLWREQPRNQRLTNLVLVCVSLCLFWVCVCLCVLCTPLFSSSLPAPPPRPPSAHRRWPPQMQLPPRDIECYANRG